MKFKEIIKARYLRKSETKEEIILWKELRNNKLGIKFRRQHPIDVFVIDFYAPKIKLAIELDGSQHTNKNTKEYDEMRTEFLKSKDITVLRFWNNELKKDLNNVINKIQEKIVDLSRN